MNKTGHAERTADQPRNPSLYEVILRQIDEISQSVRLYRLEIPPTVGSIKFLPGQWLDVFVPGIDRPGGFTITSPPSRAQPQQQQQGPAPYLELAVQKSPDNAVAHWLWRPAGDILSSGLKVRVGGNFVWPPSGVLPTTLRKLVFVAGGVGVNPLMSIVSHLAETADPRHTIDFLYSVRDPGDGTIRDASTVLFMERLAGIFSSGRVNGRLRLFLTPSGHSGGGNGSTEGAAESRVTGLGDLEIERRRITTDDVASAIGTDKRFAVIYICGLPTMTDEFVEKLTSAEGLGIEHHRVLYEKWW